MSRTYRQRKRAADRDQTRDRILQATMQLHDEQGVAVTSFTEIAERAGVGPATVYRHFPKLGDLVMACGVHVWEEMRPPQPNTAEAVFAGIDDPEARLTRLIEELDAFYSRGALRLGLAARDRELVPELDGFLKAVEAGVEALVREALAGRRLPERSIQVVIALSGFAMWASLAKLKLPRRAMGDLKLHLLKCGMASAQQAR
jgi:AcrR family transcriptional regulator